MGVGGAKSRRPGARGWLRSGGAGRGGRVAGGPIRALWATAAAGIEGERRRELWGPDPRPQLGQRRPEVAWPLGRAAVSGGGRGGAAVELGGGQEEREKEEGAEGDLLPTLARVGTLRWGRSTVAGGRRAELRAVGDRKSVV